MACGLRWPLRKTLSPRRVTSRSWCRGISRPRRNSAILSRTELEPISTAAKTGMVYPARREDIRIGWTAVGGFLAGGAEADANNRVIAEIAADWRAAKSARISRNSAQLARSAKC